MDCSPREDDVSARARWTSKNLKMRPRRALLSSEFTQEASSRTFCPMTRLCTLLACVVATAVYASPQDNRWTTNWTSLFDGKTLTNWASTDFAGHGDVTVGNGQIKIAMGADLSGITWTNGALPRTNYEISLQAIKLDGSDFFCGLTFPVAKSSCSLILGGWGGGVVGLSSLDDADASENETTRSLAFDAGHWYHIVLRVTAAKIEAWLDDKKIIDASIAGRKVSLRPGAIYLSEPLGVATYVTTSGLKDFKLRLIEN
jgi:hypothetical protein